MLSVCSEEQSGVRARLQSMPACVRGLIGLRLASYCFFAAYTTHTLKRGRARKKPYSPTFCAIPAL